MRLFAIGLFCKKELYLSRWDCKLGDLAIVDLALGHLMLGLSWAPSKRILKQKFQVILFYSPLKTFPCERKKKNSAPNFEFKRQQNKTRRRHFCRRERSREWILAGIKMLQKAKFIFICILNSGKFRKLRGWGFLFADLKYLFFLHETKAAVAVQWLDH